MPKIDIAAVPARQGSGYLVEDGGETVLRAGECAAFPKGTGNGHHLINKSSAMAVYLEAGSRNPQDLTTCSDVDMMSSNADGRFVHKNGMPVVIKGERVDFAERYGPWAVIAGASEGTGRSFAHQLAALGINCILIARRKGPLYDLAEELRTRHRVECVGASVDLASRDALSHIIDVTGAREVGLFINNAGSDTNDARFLDCEVDNWEKLVDRNVMNAMRLSYHFGRLMRDRGHGGIILVGSGACYGGATGMAVYAGTKAFDLCFGEGLWAELRPHGVHVLNLILGRTNTPMFRAFMQKRGLPLGDGVAEPDDVAKLGLERLPFGPVQNWGAADDEPGFAPISAAARRERILRIEAASNNLFKTK